MKKYFKDELTEKKRLSEYLELPKSEFKFILCDTEEQRKARTKYIMGILGDVELDKETYMLFIGQFQCSGGKYDVRTKAETFRGMYYISQKYPFLTAASLDEIWFCYIDDLFEEYELDEVLGKYFEIYGKTEKSLDKYLEYVSELADKFDRKFDLEAAKLDAQCEYYGSYLIKHLQFIIKRQHITAEQVIKALPEKELIEKDKRQLAGIMSRTRIFFGACYPISYQMIESLATGEGLDGYPEQPQYAVTGLGIVDATFTKKKFLESIKKQADKKLKPIKK